MKSLPLQFLLFFSLLLKVQADVRLPQIFGNHMVLQQAHANPVWGKAEAGETVNVSIAKQSHATVADDEGKWKVVLDPLEAGGPYTLTVTGKNRLQFEDVLVGEVWFCSGQSNMEWTVEKANHAEVELVTASNAQIRLLKIKKVGGPELKDDVEGEWKVSSAESVANFSAVGYFFGKRLQAALDVPIGLIDNSWGGSAAEAWVPRDVLVAAGEYDAYIQSWDEKCAAYSDEIHAEKVAEFNAWKAEGSPAPKMKRPRDPRSDQHRPANIYNGMIHPLTGYGIRGVIWYQGETNTGRSTQYRDLFPLLISTWRNLWQQGDFSFYWVQLANHGSEASQPVDDGWARLREAQTMTRALPNSGEAVIIDAGEGRDVHPRDKQTVADRLVRHALAKDYGFKMASDSPHYASMKIEDGGITLTFDAVSEDGLRAFDVKEVKGFSIAGADQKFVWAEAEIIGKKRVKVSSALVPEPVAVRYGWSRNPVVNLEDRNGLQVTPFRTDDW